MNTVMRFIPPDLRDGRIAELEAQIVAQASLIEALEAKLDLAAARHRELEEVIADLRARLGENSRNLSKPPSSDRGNAPAELAQGRFGPRLAATVAVLTGMYRLSKRNALRLLEYVMGLEMALGTSSKLERHTSRALMEPVAEVAAAIHASPVVHIDETSWTEEKRTAWLWSIPTMPSAPFVRASSTAKPALAPIARAASVSSRGCSPTSRPCDDKDAASSPSSSDYSLGLRCFAHTIKRLWRERLPLRQPTTRITLQQTPEIKPCSKHLTT